MGPNDGVVLTVISCASLEGGVVKALTMLMRSWRSSRIALISVFMVTEPDVASSLETVSLESFRLLVALISSFTCLMKRGWSWVRDL